MNKRFIKCIALLLTIFILLPSSISLANDNRLKDALVIGNKAFTYLGSYRSIGENIAYRYPISDKASPQENARLLAQQFFSQWKDSKDHYENMISPHHQYFSIGLGLGSYGSYQRAIAVQIFWTPSR